MESDRNFVNLINGVKMSILSGFQPEADLQAGGLTGDTNSATADSVTAEVLVQTTRHDDETILTKDQLLLHVDALRNLSQLSVEYIGE